eukprot:3755259-Rhodomonas_salina.1
MAAEELQEEGPAYRLNLHVRVPRGRDGQQLAEVRYEPMCSFLPAYATSLRASYAVPATSL